MTVPLTPPTQTARPWYREPYVWLVLGGPLAVILASMVTLYLAVQGADPVLDRKPALVKADPAQLGALTDEERLAAQRSALPAGQGRNHVVSPTLPKP